MRASAADLSRSVRTEFDTTVTILRSSSSGASSMARILSGESGLFASSTISWNRSCATMFSRSTAATPVRLP